MPEMVVKILGDTSRLEQSYRKATRDTQKLSKEIGQTGRGALAASVAFKGLGRQVAYASSAFLGGAGFVAAVKGSIDAASNLHEQMSKSNVVFGGSAKSVEGWAKTTTQALGLAQDQALETASSFGALLRPLGVTGAEAAKQSKTLTQLGADLASFYNTSVQDALDAIRSGIVGESEPLRRYGVLLSESRVQQEALAETGKKHASALTNQEKAQARVNLIMRDTSRAQGDFRRTSGGLANQQRILQANIRQLQIGIGTALLPTVNKIVKSTNEWLSKSSNQKTVLDNVKQAVSVATGVFNGLRDALEDVNKVTGSTKETLKLLFGALVAFKTAKFAAQLADIAGSLGLIGTRAAGSAGKVGRLNTALLGLPPQVTTTVVAGLVLSEALKKFLHWSATGLPGATAGGGIGGGPSGIKPNDPASWPLENLAAFAAQHGAETYAWYLKHPAAAMQVARRSLKRQGMGAFVSGGFTAGAATAAVGAAAAAGAGSGRGGGGVPPLGAAALSRWQRNQLALAMAGRTASTADNMKALLEERRLLDRRITVITGALKGATGKTAKNLAETLQGLYDADAQAFGQITQITEQAAQDAKDEAAKQKRANAKRRAAQTKAWKDALLGQFRAATTGPQLHAQSWQKAAAGMQFKALGLTAAGQQRAKSVKWLRRRAKQVATKISGTSADTPGNRARLARINLVLSGQFGQVRPEVADEIRSELDDIAGDVSSGDTMPISRFAHVSPSMLAARLGLGGNRAAIGILAQYGAGGSLPKRSGYALGGGGGMVVTGNTMHFHGIHNAKQFQNEMQKLQRGQPSNRRGAR